MRTRPALKRTAAAIVVHGALGLFAAFLVSACFGALGPPTARQRASEPRWPEVLPQGWPEYPWTIKSYLAGIRQEGTRGSAHRADSFGRHWHDTAVLELKSKTQRAYHSLVFRTGFPLKAGIVRTLVAWPPLPQEGAVDRDWAAGLDLGIPARYGYYVGPTIPLIFDGWMLAANAIFWAAVSLLITVTFRAVRRGRRRSRNLCEKCGYPRGDHGRCSECGHAVFEAAG